MSKALTVPKAAASANKLHTEIVSVATITPSAVAIVAARTWVICNMRQRL